jgi:hypothetical protein
MNCCVIPAAMLAVAGVTAIAVKVFTGTVTVMATALLVTPPEVAVMFVDPAAMPVANPEALIVATEAVPEVHVTVEVRLAVDPSL